MIKNSLTLISNFKRKALLVEAKIINNTKNFVKDNKYLLQSFIIILIIYLVAFIAIIRADFNYEDDFNRLISGMRGWDSWSRWTSNYLSVFIHRWK